MNRVRLAARTNGLVGWTVLYLMVAAALFAVLVKHIGIVSMLQVSTSLILLGVLPGAALIRRLFPHPDVLHYVIVGAVVGLGLWSLGGLLSDITALYWVRWIPSGAALGLWFVPRRSVDGTGVTDRPGFPPLGVIGSVLGLIALLPSVQTVLLSQPVRWTGWHHFYSDLPFHVALTSEVAVRVPQSYPWVTDTPLSYTWLYHSAMGVWASVTNVSAADVVLQAWPVLFAVLVPATISIVAWEITRNKYVAMGSPLFYVLAQGLVLSPARLEPSPIFQISPTRDFAALFILLAVLSLARLLGHRSLRAMNLWWFLMLGISTFVATGAKGSAMPILLGGLLCAALVLIVLRRVRVTDLLALGVFAAAAACSFLLILPDSGSTQSLAWGPLTFLDPSTPVRSLVSMVILAILAFATFGAWVVIGRSDSGGWLVSSLICGVAAAGLLGLGLLTHSGSSQLYFWQSAQPLFAIILTWASAILIGTYGKKFAVAGLTIFLMSNVLWLTTQRIAVVGAAIVVMALCAMVILKISTRESLALGRPRSWLVNGGVALAIAGVLTQSAQLVTIPVGVVGGSTTSKDDPGAINGTQLAAFQFIRSHSDPTNKIITNKHCLSGNLREHNCDSRWFAVAAWAERRVLVEGWAYTQNGTSSDWVRNELHLSDRFISSPTLADKSKLQSLGVRYVYVDKRDTYSPELASVSRPVFTSEWADVYSLK